MNIFVFLNLRNKIYEESKRSISKTDKGVIYRNQCSSTYQMQGRIPLLKTEMYNTCFKRQSNDITAYNRDLFRFCVC